MKNTFLDFIEKRQQVIIEGFSEKTLDKVIQLISSLLKKHIDGKLLVLNGFMNTRAGGEYLLAKQFIVLKGDKMSLINLNWLKSDNVSDIYSIDIFDSIDFLGNLKSNSKISIYTLGSSIVHFLPAIWTIVNSENYNLSEEEITNLSKKIYKDGSVKESYYYVGALRYHILENIDNSIIKDTFINEAIPDADVKAYKKEKLRQTQQAYRTRRDTPDGMERFKQLNAEYQEIRQAIAGGASTMKELKMAIKHNVSVVAEITAEEKELEEKFKEERESPEQVFKKMQGYVKMVIKGINPSVIICGAPGVGKTYKVKKQLKANNYMEGHNLFTIKGKCTPRRLYLALYDYQEKGKILLIDDADALVGPNAPEDCINILKAALDSTADDEGRLISYGVSGKLLDDEGNEIPKRFYYNGSVIIITNWNAGKLDTALRGRSYIQDINFTTDEVLEIIEKLMPELGDGKLSAQSKMKALTYLKELLARNAEMEVSIRTFNICANIFESVAGDPDFNDDDAKSMIKEQMKLQASRITGRGNKGKY